MTETKSDSGTGKDASFIDERFNYKMLTLAREARELTQSELAAHTKILQSTISRIEHGFIPKPDEQTVKTLSEFLNFPSSFFYQSFNIFPHNLYYRKKLKVNVRTLNKAEAIMNIYRANIQTLLKSVDLPETSIPFIDETRLGKPEVIAQYLREYWKIPKGRIDNLTKILEEKGIIIIPIDFETDNIEGLSMITDTGNYIIFLNSSFPGDRQRLTLAHELGHLIMHLTSSYAIDASVDVEKEAFIFAAEFLMPTSELKPNLSGRVTIEKLVDLKRYWKVSMQSILLRGQQLGIIQYNQARYLWSQFATRGIKKKEPIDIEKEKPTLLNEIINFHYSKEIGLSRLELSQVLHLNNRDFSLMYPEEHQVMRRIG
jgi:Zn-dependent peptidase ImmA (M78 family)